MVVPPGRASAVRGRAYRSAMLDVDARLAELEELGPYRRMRMVSGPQGPRVVLDGRPVLLLCSDNHLGLADHPRVREAAADAAMRWGAGAGAPRPGAGTMTLHRRLEERLADFLGTDAALLFGSGYLTNLGVIPALAERGEIVFTDALNHPSVVDACRLAGAEAFVYDHGDVEHLAWGLRNADGRAALIVTEGVFALDGDVAPLEAIVALAHRFDVRVMVGEAHGARRRRARRPRRGRRRRAEPPGRRDRRQPRHRRSAPRAATRPATARSPATSRRTRARSRARPRCRRRPPPPRWRRSSCCASSRGASRSCRTTRSVLRTELAREGFDVAGADTHVVSLVVGDARLAVRIAELALEQGVYVGAVRPPDVPEGCARLRLAAMASHTKSELRDAARVLGRAALRAGFRPGAGVPVVVAQELPQRARRLRRRRVAAGGVGGRGSVG